MAAEFPLPADLPVPPPSQRLAVIHLGGHPLPPLIELPSTSGGYVDLFLLSLTRPILLFIYPRTASPGEQVDDSWNGIAGARGCTPHLCNVRDQLDVLRKREPDLAIFGLSVQHTDVQREAVERLHLPFALLSDVDLRLQKALDLPTFTWRDTTYLARTTLLLREGQVTQFQHPVFPPTQAAQEALKMLDAGKPAVDAAAAAPTAAQPKMTSDEACVEERIEHLLEKIQSIENERQAAQSMPVPRDLTGSIRSFKGLQRAMNGSNDWRNSLVAVDRQTGEVVGILAQNVTLSRRAQGDSQAARPSAQDVLRSPATAATEPTGPVSPPSDEDLDEIPTPPAAAVGRLSAPRQTYFDKDVRASSKANERPVVTLSAAQPTYRDADVRPVSREGSVLGEDTFAPPPVPEKPQFLRPQKAISTKSARISFRSSTASMPFHTANETDDATSAAEDDDVFSDGEAVDGLVRTRARHVEAHRPDLLRDAAVYDDDDDETASDASGSTIGGPAVQLWRKARGGKKGEARRKAKKEAKVRAAATMVVEAADQRRRDGVSRASDASVRTSRAETAMEGDVESGAEEEAETEAEAEDLLPADAESHPGPSHLPPTSETVNAARAQRFRRDQIATSEVRSIEDNVWQSALEAGCLPIDAPYTHLAAVFAKNDAKKKKDWIEEATDVVTDGEESAFELASKNQKPRKKTAAAKGAMGGGAIMQGNSVLIEFLAGSRIAASVIHEAASNFMNVQNDTRESSVVAALRQAPDAFSPTNLDVIPQTGALRYIPVLPDHLLWFFGLNLSDSSTSSANGEARSDARSLLSEASPSSLSVANVASMGGDLVRLTASAPGYLLEAASRSASQAWGSMTSWLQSYVSGSSGGDDRLDARLRTDDDLFNILSPGDEDAAEWEWTVPQRLQDELESTSLANTPRPVYRRKRPVPSVYGGFQVRQLKDDFLQPVFNGDQTIQRSNSSSRYSIVHFDNEGVGRHAVLSAGMLKK